MENNQQDCQNEFNAIDELLGFFFFGCNVPFVILESVYFKNFVKALNPNYCLPARKTLSNKILNSCYQKLQKSACQTETKNAVLLLDGWKNKSANSNTVVAMLKLDCNENKKYLYLHSWDFSIQRETGEALQEIVIECIGMAREKYNLQVFSVISDNASNMIRMGNLVNIWHVTCSSHSANLLCKSIVDHVFASKVNKLLKEFKKPALEAQLLQRGGNRMVLIGETRWCSHRDALRRCLRNLDIMKEVVRDQQFPLISDDCRIFLFDPNFEMLLQENLLILDPICQLINISQKADCSIAEATEYWLKLELPVDDDNYERIIKERKKKAISVFGLAANYLHPVYQGRRFENNNDYSTLVDNFFCSHLSPQGVQELEIFRNKEGIFKALFEKNYSLPTVYWRCAKKYYPELGELALKLHTLCSSTAQLERLFSEWAYVHDSKRNRLSSERSSKLSIYYEARLKEVFREDIDSEED